MTLRAKLHPTTKRERRKNLADACLVAYRMRQESQRRKKRRYSVATVTSNKAAAHTKSPGFWNWLRGRH